MPLIVKRCGHRWIEELPGSPLALPLVPLSWLFALAASLRSAAYDQGWARIQRLPCPVVSIGNVVAGGSGKTPVARTVANLLTTLGRRPAVLARGYRRLDSQGNDEARLLGGIPVFSDGDRVAAGRAALAAGHDALVLDDGFQHRRLHRDLDIVVVDATRPWGDPGGGPGRCLPAGYRREPVSALRRAGLVWITRAHLAPQAATLLRERFVRDGLTVITDGEPQVTVECLGANATATATVLVSGIGHPGAFELDAARAGCAPRLSLRWSDHHHFTAADAGRIRHEAGAGTVVMTAKDAVKLAPLRQDSDDWRVLNVIASPDPAGLELLRRRLLTLVRDWPSTGGSLVKQ